MLKDYYKILGVAKDATQEDIKKAWRKAALQYHPDASNDPTTADKFKEASEAYEVLGDPQKRSRYDQGGSDFEGWNINFQDMFSSFFGSRPRRNTPQMHVEVELDFLDAVKGCTKEVKVSQSLECSACKGTGAAEFTTCRYCGGAGHKVIRQSPFVFQQTCDNCRGTGKAASKLCSVCNGSGHISGKEESVSVDIPAGIENGMRIKTAFTGGDLYVLVLVKPHPDFMRIGTDLVHEVSVAYTHLVLGEKVEVPTIDGKAVLKIPPKTKPGSKFRLDGLGITGIRNPARVGDLIVVVNLKMPEKVSARQKEILKELVE